MKHLILSRLTSAWVCIVFLIMFGSPHTSTSTFYRFGPSENLVILGGIRINTSGKYLLIMLYSIINTCLRSAKVNIISPWITLNVQDESKPIGNLNKLHAYEITLVANLYTWIDWWISINMLMSQIDLVFIEVLLDFVTLYYITRNYLSIAERQPGHTLLDAKDIEINGVQVA
jgi:hypothetical protein